MNGNGDESGKSGGISGFRRLLLSRYSLISLCILAAMTAAVVWHIRQAASKRYENILRSIADVDPAVIMKDGVPTELYFYNPLANLALRQHHLEAVSTISSLRAVGIVHAPNLSDEDVSVLATLPLLESLRLNYVPVNDDAIAQLCEAKHLRTLNVEGTKVSDASVPHIETLPDLGQLNIINTNVSALGAERLLRIPTLRTFAIGPPAKGLSRELATEFNQHRPSVTTEVHIPDPGWLAKGIDDSRDKMALLDIQKPCYCVRFAALLSEAQLRKHGLTSKDIREGAPLILRTLIKSMTPAAREFFAPYISRMKIACGEDSADRCGALLEEGVDVEMAFGCLRGSFIKVVVRRAVAHSHTNARESGDVSPVLEK